ncbi:PEP/pyruvate-binding domain-containing protein [Streptomyces litchfieldiae]|uniref:PEP/pyruvate-binding domain-containing protein n=1 Tax=Streptomyces litchfieldiae TaxID=3075543 RepID=A0ABU2MN76_9ACTN|nr:PEP/pyruvate-binding domain-containing protein [Streptomyces sp. DSM 44938]MDT0343061.1 PEP/pyruvate-binding domain-containing protein [Streptomyces sp. DSM 44938]
MGIDADRLAVVPLTAERAADATLTGAKAAALARARAAGLPVLPGFALVPGQGSGTALREAWEGLTEPLVVRSSSVLEDTAHASMAGRFATVLEVRGWEGFTRAVRTVLDSAPGDGSVMAVLVQPMVRSTVGGVMFGADPVAGRRDRILISAVRGGPDQLVGGSAQGVRYQVTRLGRLVRTEPPERRGHRVLGRRKLARLVQLARRAERALGGPQDVEFGFDTRDRLWLFQARPITAMAARAVRGARLLGPGPVAETFPGVLQPLEEDLWVEPMSHGLTLALDVAGTAPRRLLRGAPVVLTVGGRAAADLRLLGAVPSAHPVLDFVNPVPGARRASAAWRVGRLRSALPLLALDLMAEVDQELAELPPPGSMLSGELLAALSWGRAVLSALHAQESLAGALLDGGAGPTATGEALAVLAERRAAGDGDGDGDGELIARHPVLLALLPPAVRGTARLPEHTGWTGAPHGVGALPPREGLRLRIRWVQEMQARLVRECAARRRAAKGGGDALGELLSLRWPELTALLEEGREPPDLAERRPRPAVPELPTAFRLAADGQPVPERLGHRKSAPGGGQGAGGGRGTGTAWHGTGPRPDRAVLVVRSLDPALAPRLPGLAGLVSETGSVLSHLAVLAREHRVPTVVGVPGALERCPPGSEVTVDGTTGAVT